MTAQPFSLPLNRDNIPVELTRLAQWVTWRFEERKTGWTKPPINVYSGVHASTTDARTWAPYEALAKEPRVGFVVTKEDHYSFIDIDNGWDHAGAQPKAWAAAVIRDLPVTYWERSPSGNGLKGLIRGKARANRRVVVGDGAVEVWGWDKYTTITGQRLEDAGRQVVACPPGALDRLIDALAPPNDPVQPLTTTPDTQRSDAVVLAQVRRSPEACTMIDHGTWPSSYPSQSEADLGLLDHFVRAGATTPDQLDRLFRATAMMREKWDSSTYRTRTLEKALNGVVQPTLRVIRSNEAALGGLGLLPTLLDGDVYCAHIYPLHIWPDVFRRYIEDVSQAIGAIPDALAVPLLTVLGGIIGNRRVLRVKSTRIVKPIIWSLVIGKTGRGKTPMFEAAQALIEPLQEEAIRVYRHELREWDRAQGERRQRGRPGGQAELPLAQEKPVLQHFYSTDITIEAVAADLQGSPGLAVLADEALAWFQSLNQYKGGKGGDRENWSKLQTGAAIKVNRKTSDPIHVRNPAASFHGGIQPERLSVLAADGFVDGWVARFMVCLPRMGVLYPNTFDPSDLVIADALHLAASLRPRVPREAVTLTPAAFQTYFDWSYENSAEAERVAAFSQPLSTATIKLENYLLRVALVLQCAWDPEGREACIDRAMIERAIDLIEYHRSHAEVVYQILTSFMPADSHHFGLARRILKALTTLGGGGSKKDIRVALGGKDFGADEFTRTLEHLVSEGAITLTVVPTTGRSAEVYTIVM